MHAVLIAMALAAASPPSPEARDLGRQLAEQGMLAALLPTMKAQETEALVKEDPALDAAGQARLRATADRVFATEYQRVMAATGDAYAERLDVEELKALVAFFRTPAAAKYRSILPQVVAATMQSIGKLDFKGEVRKAFCAETKRLCESR